MAGSSWTEGPPRKILLATDLSARCDRALDRAAALATAWHVPLVAVHALEQEDAFYRTELERRLPSWRSDHDPVRIAEEQLHRDITPSAAEIKAIVERGDPADIILEAAAREDCELIVTGLARDETLGRFGLGTTVDRLLRRSTIPLLIVKGRVHSSYRTVLVATDFSDPSRQALHAAMTFFPDQKLTVFHAYEARVSGLISDTARYLEECRDAAVNDCAAFLDKAIPQERRSRLELVVESGTPSQSLQEYVRGCGVDLAVIGTHGRGALFEVLIGSTAKDILTTLSCDALVVRGPRSATGKEPS